MKLQQELTDFGKERIQQWRTVMDELEVQLSLGKAEARDMYEEEKKNISAYINKQKAQLNEGSEAKLKQQEALKLQLENLYMCLNADLAKSKRSYDRNKKESLRLIHELELELKMKSSEFESWIGGDLDELKEVLDNYRIKLALSSYETVEGTLDSKKELQSELQEMMDGILRQIYPGGSNINRFMDEVSEGLEHLKRAFTEIMN